MTNTLTKGGIGVMAPVASFFVSRMEQIEIGLRIAGLVLGVLVSLAMLISILNGMRDRRRLRAVNIQAAERDLCLECLEGFPPLECPIPQPHRPAGCPRK